MVPLLLLVSVGLSVFGAMIGMQLIVSLGISANTSIIGALIAIVFSRIPLEITRRFRVLERQNLVQTAISSATFGAANSLMIPIGVPYAMGMPELATPMLIGAVIAMFVDGAMLYFLFGSKIFPATGTWPAGIATAEAIWAATAAGARPRSWAWASPWAWAAPGWACRCPRSARHATAADAGSIEVPASRASRILWAAS